MTQRIATNKPAITKHDERFDAAWRYRYGQAALAYTDHWIICEKCSTARLCPEGERLNALCLDIESEMVELSNVLHEEERKTA